MTTYKYLGWGTTDENGVAHLDHDANGDPLTHSYTGVGAGEVDVLASLDNPVSEGSIVSETYTIHDCIITEIASATYGSATAPAAHTVIKTFKINSDIYVFEAPFSMEFDVESITNGSGLRLRIMEEDTSPIFNIGLGRYDITSGSHIKICISETDCKIYVDDVMTTVGTGTAENNYGVSLLQLKDNVASVTVKNVEFYIN